MRIGTRVIAVAGALLLFAPSAQAADVTGKWKAEFDTQIGVQKYTYDLKVEEGKLTGKASFERMGQKGDVELKEGKVTGDDIAFVEKLDFQGTEMSITYTGKVTADEIKFTRKVGDFATEEFVAKRARE
jgi:opacity protein-like surface antigen